MVSSGLYTAHAIPTPDVVLGQHVLPHPTGTVTTKPGAMMSAADSFQITIFGSGGHGSMPHRTVDPVVVTAHIVVRLQSVVSREVPPDETAVVTVGSIRGGETENVISDHAVLKVDVRSVSQEWRDRILEAVMRIVKAECVAGRCPREPLFERTREFPITFNDAETNEVVEEAFESYFGGQHRRAMKPELVSEDFSILATSIERPCVYWFFGGVEKEEWQRREREGTLDQIPVNHSAFFKPVLQPTLRTGVDALVVAALAFVGKKAEAGGVKRGGD